MNRHIAPVLAIIFHFAAASLPAAEPPPAVAALKTAGINVSALKEGGWNVEVREAKDLDEITPNWDPPPISRLLPQ